MASMGAEQPWRDAVLCVDIGGTKFAAGLMTTDGELIDRNRVEVDNDAGAEILFDLLTELVIDQRERAAHHRVRILSVGVGAAGPIAADCETVSPINIGGWNGFPLRARLVDLTGLAVFGDLDAKALAMAEGWQGAAQGMRNFCAMTVSTGIGGGLVVDGRLLDGASGNAGHVGHIIVEPGGRRCGCGARGCLEAEASGLAIEAITGRSPTEPTYEIMRRTGTLVGRAAAMLCTSLDLELVVVGGSVAIGFAATFFNAAQEELDRIMRTAASPVMAAAPLLVSTRLADAGPLIGAGAVGLRGLRRSRSAR
jgi:glucokinase